MIVAPTMLTNRQGTNMPVNTDLGEVILTLNPYSNNANPRRALTGPVDIYMTAPVPSWPPGGPAPAGTINQVAGQEPAGAIPQVQVEMESDYPAEWHFKGQLHKVYKTARIRYRFPVLD